MHALANLILGSIIESFLAGVADYAYDTIVLFPCWDWALLSRNLWTDRFVFLGTEELLSYLC